MNDDLKHIPAQLSALIETDDLRAAIHKLRAFRFESDHGAKLVCKIKRSLRYMMRELSRLEMFNKKVWLKHNMLTDSGWRDQVLEDLGGEPALERWEKRKAKADSETIAPRIVPYVPDEDTASQDTPKSTSVKTDRDGLFRLAPITQNIRKLTVQEDFARWEAQSWRNAMRDTPKVYKPKPRPIEEPFRPIPVTPSDLRGETMKRNRTWEQIRAEEAAEEQQERDYIEGLINLSDSPPPRQRGRCRNAVEAEGAADSPQISHMRSTPVTPSDPTKNFGGATSPAKAVEEKAGEPP